MSPQANIPHADRSAAVAAAPRHRQHRRDNPHRGGPSWHHQGHTKVFAFHIPHAEKSRRNGLERR
jgi:hypothetical protein